MDIFGGANTNRRNNITGGSETSTLMIIIVVVLLVVVVGGGLYWYFKMKPDQDTENLNWREWLVSFFKPRPDHVTVNGPFNLKGVTASAGGTSQVSILDASQLSSKTGNNFTISAFVYMDEFNAERIPIAGPAGDFRFKPLIYILGVGTITVDPIHQKARVSLQPLTDRALRKVDSPVEVIIDNFVVARWNQITVSVLGRSADVYLNGRLIKSAMLENVPILSPVGLLLETIPDFSGQAGLIQAWPRRLTIEEVMRNYKQNVDLRGKPDIKIEGMSWSEVWENFKKQLCKVGFCGFKYDVGPMAYVDYEFA